MDIPKRSFFLAGFGWAGAASLLTWLIPVLRGAPVGQNGIDLLFGALILGGVGYAVYEGSRQNPSTISLLFALGATIFSTLELVRVIA